MSILKEQLDRELAKEKPNKYQIEMLKRIITKGILTLQEWSATGKFTPINAFMEDNPNATLHVDCADVVSYIDGSYIQALKSGEFYIDASKESNKNLDHMERILWFDRAEKLFNI